jgi:MFS family permease
MDQQQTLTLRVVAAEAPPAAAALTPAVAAAAAVPPAAITPTVAAAAATPAPAPALKDDGFALRGMPLILVMFALCLAVFIGGLDDTIVVVAMPTIADEFDSLSLISWIVLAVLLTQTAGTPLWGRASDMLGRKNAMLVAIGSFVTGSVACALSTSFAMLAVSRAVQGFGGGGLVSVTLILVADVVPPAQRGAYLAPINSFYALSSVVGPIVGGYITDGPGWRWCFWINVPIGAACAAIIYYYVPRTIGRSHMVVAKGGEAVAAVAVTNPAATPAATAAVTPVAAAAAAPVAAAAAAPVAVATATPVATAAATTAAVAEKAGAHHDEAELDIGTVDWAGIVLVVTSVSCLCLAVTWGGEIHPWGSWRIVLLLVIAALTSAALVYVETFVARDPVVPMRLFARWNYTICIALGFFFGWAVTGPYIFLPIFFQIAKGASASQSGERMIPMMLAMPVGAGLCSAGLGLLPKLDWKLWPIVGMTLSAVATGLYTTMDADTPAYQTVGNLILGGLGGGMAIMVPMVLVQESVDVKDVATATASLQFFQAIAGLLSAAIMQSFFNQRVADLVPSAAQIEAEAMAGVSVEAIGRQVMDAYSTAVTSTFYVSIAGPVAGALAACLFRYVPLGGEHEQAAPAATAAGAEKAAGAEEAAGEAAAASAVDVAAKPEAAKLAGTGVAAAPLAPKAGPAEV